MQISDENFFERTIIWRLSSPENGTGEKIYPVAKRGTGEASQGHLRARNS